MKGYRTLLINIIPCGLMLTDYIINHGAVVNLVFSNPTTAASVIMLGNIINILLRSITDTPMLSKEPKRD